MSTKYNINHHGAKPFSANCGNVLLAASTAISYTVPGTDAVTYRAEFSVSSSADVWVRKNGTAAVPTSNTMATTTYQERINTNTIMFVQGGDTLSFISTTTPQVGVSLLQLP